MSENYFTELYNINVNDKTEKKKDLTYLSWAWAWAEFKKKFPDATYEILKFDGKPYVYDEALGYMCYTTVTVGDLTHEMWLPVMDGANKAMKAQPYTYTVKQYGKEVEKTCNAATMFDVNKTLMRCLTKNLAMFGLGLYIYAGEDLPEDDRSPQQVKDEEHFEKVGKEIITKKDLEALNERCKNDGVDTVKLAVLYKVENLSLLSMNQYSNINMNWEKVKEKAAV